jgi:threonine dehydrogenase-like Zn-dependent dehydrogenase
VPACSTLDCWRAAEIINSGCIDLAPVISARLPLKDALQAFAMLEEGNTLKIVLEP